MRYVLKATSRRLLFLMAVLLSVSSPSRADWPERTITIVVPFPAGGLTDVAARHLAAGLQSELKQAVVVENKVGAGGIIGTEFVSRAKPDGYTLLVNSPSHVINQALRPRMPFHAIDNFTPIAQLLTSPMVLVVPNALPVNNLAEYLAYARKQDGGVSFGSTGTAGTSHLAGEMLRVMTKAPMVHVPYRGASPALNDLLGGQLPSIFLDVATMAQYVSAGRVRALAVSTAERSDVMPSIPTVAEQGYPKYNEATWIAFYGPADLPPALVERLNAIARRTMSDPKMAEWLKTNGAKAGAMDVPQFGKFVRDELAKWTEFNEAAKVSLD